MFNTTAWIADGRATDKRKAAWGKAAKDEAAMWYEVSNIALLLTVPCSLFLVALEYEKSFPIVGNR